MTQAATVPYSRSRNWETRVSELSVCSRDSEGVGVHREKLAESGLSNWPAVVHQVQWGLTVE